MKAMKHYSNEEWQELIEEEVNDGKKIEMLEHTIECQNCLDIYLSLIDGEINNKNTAPPPDFSSRVIERINADNKKLELLKKKKRFTNIMIFYASAACITLFLISQGCFGEFLNISAKSSKAIHNQSKITGFMFSGWTDTLTEKTSNFINNIIK